MSLTIQDTIISLTIHCMYDNILYRDSVLFSSYKCNLVSRNTFTSPLKELKFCECLLCAGYSAKGILNTLSLVPHHDSLGGWYYFHFKTRKSKAQRGLMLCPKSHMSQAEAPYLSPAHPALVCAINHSTGHLPSPA